MVFYTQSTSAVISGRETDRQRQTDRLAERERERVKWCFTPSQPVQLYQGERQTGRDRQTDRQRQTGKERERW